MLIALWYKLLPLDGRAIAYGFWKRGSRRDAEEKGGAEGGLAE
jgi:hypothetical protein